MWKHDLDMLYAGHHFQYNRDKLKMAVSEVQSGEKTVYQASKDHGLPKETVRRHVKGATKDFKKPGRDPLLTMQEEQALLEYIQYYVRHNFPLTRQDLCGIILVCVT